MLTLEATKLQWAEELLKPLSSGTLEEPIYFSDSGVYFKGISATMEAWTF